MVVGPKNTTYIWTPQNIIAGSYELFIVPDNADRSGAVGNDPSCLADGFPLGGKMTFRIIAPPSGNFNPSSNPYPPATSSALSDYLNHLWLLIGGFIIRFYF